MKSATALRFIKAAICLALAVLLWASAAWATPTTPEQAKNVVLNWLGKDAVPLGAPLGRQIKEVQTFTDGAGAPTYYVVYLSPAGMVLLPADDLVEPIIGFLPDGFYDPSPTNPLGALVSQDIPGRVLEAREKEAQALDRGVALAPQSSQSVAQRKWAWLLNSTPTLGASEFGISPISDVRVPSFVMSRWNQAGADGSLPDPNCNYPCYNYFTPPNAGGNPGNYVSGCVATAMSQLLRYWTYPTNGIGVHTYTYYVSGVSHSGSTRGGNDSGGSYNWGSMPTTTSSSTTDTQRAAIGRLTWDAGLAVNMNYDTLAHGGSGTDTLQAADAFVNTFQYSNAKKGYNSASNLPAANRNNMVNPNLHAGYPVLFGISGNGGHAIVCDGYGYNGGTTMYHHLNLGWSGSNDAWYNLPTIDTSDGTWTSVYKCVYNVYPSGSGEIIAGRVTESNGITPVNGVTVSATGGYSTTTNANGIYALAKVPSAHSYTVSATKTGYTFTPQVVNTGTSTNMTTTTGNVWGVDFVAGSGPVVTLNQALDNTVLSFTSGGNANWFGETTTWTYGGSAAQTGAIGNSQASWLQTTVTGPGTMTFYFKVSSEMNYDWLRWYLDGGLVNGWSGEKDWTQFMLRVPAGIHTIKWEYSKDVSVSSGSDCGWVDRVVYNHGGAGSAVLELLLLN